MQFITKYAEIARLRAKLNELSMLAFGINSLSEGDIYYIPFSLFEEDKIIANVSVGKLHIVIEGKKLATHIIQTVATLPKYRKRGLVKHIFTYVDPFLALHADKSFLLASKSLKEFYAQFAYQTTEMASRFIALPPKVKLKRNKLLHVDIKDTSAYDSLSKKAAARAPVSDVFGNIELNWLFLWYCKNIYADDIYYIVELDIYLIFQINNDELLLIDIVGTHIPPIELIYAFIGNNQINKISYLFTPDKVCSHAKPIIDDLSYFFYRDGFPIPNRPFTLPMTARG